MIQITPIGQALAPSFDHPIEMLEACHDKVRHFTHQLAQLPAHLDQFGITDATIQTIHGILRYFDVAAPLHHADEEQNLFLIFVPDGEEPPALVKGYKAP